jgi:putative ABC transport system permease protein
MHTLLSDLRSALRTLGKSPGFAAVAILTLALGLGANTAIFSFVDAVLLKPLPYHDPDQILALWERRPDGGENGISSLNYLDWRNQNTVFQHIAAVSGTLVTLSGRAEPEQFNAQLASASYFDLFGTKAALGRTFAPDEDQPGKGQVAVLSARLWESRFGADPQVIGKTIRLDGKEYTIIGVLPPGSIYDRMWAQIWLPLVLEPASPARSFHWLRAFARPKPGVTLAQARAEMDTIAARIAKDYPDSNKGWGIAVSRYVDEAVGRQLKQSLYVLLAAVGLVLLIACVNLANLLLARGAARSREIAIRSALGAGRARLVRQLLTESLLLALCGAAAGLGLGLLLMRSIKAWLPPYLLPAQADVRLDYRVLLFLLLIAVLTAILFGLGPALQLTGRDAGESLKEGGRSGSSGVSHQRLRSSLVVTEVALAFVLLVGAGLLIRSFERLMNVDPGFETTNVITMSLPMVMGRDTDGPRVANYLTEILDAIQNVPGIRDAAVTSRLPMQGWGIGMWFQIAGHQFVERPRRPSCYFKVISPSYFHALGMKLRQGRGLAESDGQGALPVTVINETMRKRYFPNEDSIGKRILIQQIITGKHELGPEVPWEVVGVVADEKVGGLDDNSPGLYVPYRQSPIVGMELLVRAAGDPRVMLKDIQHAVWQVNKDQALPDGKMLEEIKSQSTASDRLRTVLLGVFAVIALALAAIGIYGVISYSVAQRTHELGIRAALGAGAADLLRLVIGHGMSLVALGLALGVLGALAAGRVLSTLLFNTKPTDVPTLLAVGAVLAMVALAACYVPARRASKVDPMVALRYE